MLILEFIWNPKSVKFGDEFLDVFSGCLFERFWSGFGHVLGDFLVPKREAKGKGRICENVCFTFVILQFSWFVGFIRAAKMREKQSGIPIWIKTRFYDDFVGSF